ncbi:homoserine dehydrogenase [Pseudoglutamicibacter cumminsii]|uniref:homoserine dehydrogenase n=1 Tax=Pseudoglutamicibacter cumminsii TaxID=156979 RepID=UPI001959DBB7|nr:homoserine dehydrogenase [Pseudoglutamicibacter cumminsii]
MTTTLKVALLGAGTVGAEVARILRQDQDVLREKTGASLELSHVVVRNTEADRGPWIDRGIISADASAAIADADVVIELMGGIEPAKSYIVEALSAGKDVVTGNKALIAESGAELNALAREKGAQLFYEAAVAGAIPILRPIYESLAGDNITSVMGIVNGSTNYILDKMDREGASLDAVMEEASALGYLEADPSADVDGHDAAAKAAILATYAFGTPYTIDQVYTEGIRSVTAGDVKAAQENNQVIKLLAIVNKTETGVSMRVHPALISREHPLAAVHGAFNAVFVEAENAGQLMFYGAGAGGAPTASAVMGDVVTAVRQRISGTAVQPFTLPEGLPALTIDDTVTRYAIGIEADDTTGVLAQIAQTFAQHGVSIESMKQDSLAVEDAEQAGEPRALLRLITHAAQEFGFAATVEDLKKLDVVRGISSVLRVEGGEA